tara:strand:+ start:558 stop:959 length:402 start_codon:yes stop_codon:yes gene_type:complete
MNSQDKSLSRILAPISLGELLDKITILEIKKVHMTGKKLRNVAKELELLNCILQEKSLKIDIDLINSLRKVNNNIWEIEDKIREKESEKEFDHDFVELARSVYKENDKRASIKKEINNYFNSDLIEEKSYKKY